MVDIDTQCFQQCPARESGATQGLAIIPAYLAYNVQNGNQEGTNSDILYPYIQIDKYHRCRI